MKNIKLFLLAVVAGLFAACSEDENFNTNAVTVGFEDSEVSFNESDNMVFLPIKVTGERNGDIKLVITTEDNTAKDEEHYLITSKEINIPAGADEVKIEMRILDDGNVENDPRDFTIKIANVQGAKTSETSSVKVVLRDVDAKPFFKLFGKYEVEAYEVDGTPCNFVVTIDDEAEGTEQYLYAEGAPSCFKQSWDTKMAFLFNGDGTLTFDYGYWDGLYNFGSFLGVVCALPCEVNEQGKVVPAFDGLTIKYNDTYDTIEFEEGTAYCIGAFVYDDGQITQYAGYTDGPVYLKKMTKIAE